MEENIDEAVENNENLAELIKEESTSTNQIFNEQDLDIPHSDPPINDGENSEEVLESQEADTNYINTAVLSDWFEKNHENFENVGPVKAVIRGVTPAKTLIIASDIKGSIIDGIQERKLFVYNDADKYHVLDLPGSSMEIFNNGFKILYDFNPVENIYIKTYGIKSGLYVIFCNKINNMMIPYNITRFKKKDKTIPISINSNLENINERLTNNADVEALQIMYKPFVKDNIVTIQNVVEWFLKKQGDIFDINHLLKIDDIIIKQFS